MASGATRSRSPCRGCEAKDAEIGRLVENVNRLQSRLMDALLVLKREGYTDTTALARREAEAMQEQDMLRSLPPPVVEAIQEMGGGDPALEQELSDYAERLLSQGGGAQDVADALYRGGDRSGAWIFGPQIALDGI
jgi:hypothetical protein